MSDMSERVAKLEGRMEGVERRIDGHGNRISRVEVDIDKVREDSKELMRYLHRSEGAFNGAKWAFLALGALVSLGILSITFGG